MPGMFVKGDYYDFGVITNRIDGEEYDEISSISYSFSYDRGDVSGTHLLPKGSTRGKGAFEGSLTFATRECFDRWRKRHQPGWSRKTYLWNVAYGKGEQATIVDELTFKIAGSEFEASDGPDPLAVTVPLKIISMKLDGEDLIEEEDN
jgi:hypothetical protein